MTRPLTAKQEAFCREYRIDRNGTQAAIRAGYSSNGAEVTAHHLLRNPKVVAELAKLKMDEVQRHEITLDKLTQMAIDAHDAAKAAGDNGTAVRAIAQISKMHGFDADSRGNARSPLEGMSLDELVSIRSAVAADTEAESGTRH